MKNKLTFKECKNKIHSLPNGSTDKSQLSNLVKEINHNLNEIKTNKYSNKEALKNKNDKLFSLLRNSLSLINRR